MNVRWAIDDKEVKAMLKKYPDKIDKASKFGLARASAWVESKIKARTAAGRGVSGGFKPYSPGYLEARAKRGRGSTVDLMFTGQMMGAMQSKAKSAKLGIIYFTGGGAAQKAMWNHRTRPFFDINMKEEGQAAKIFSDAFMKNLKATT